MAFGTASNTVGGDNGLFWDDINKRLGIGTTTPNQAIQIQNASGVQNGIRISNTDRPTSGNLILRSPTLSATAGEILFGSVGWSFVFRNEQTSAALLTINDTNSVVVNLPQLTIQNRLVFVSDAVAINRNSNELDVVGFSGITFKADNTNNYQTAATRMRLVGSSGNLLLNTTTDAGFRLDVNGTARVQGVATITADAVVNGVNIGIGAGAVSSNTRVGNAALNANTTGASNTANGAGALQLNTTGFGNTANGWRSLQSNTTGSSNTANGVQALVSNTTGTSNTVNGYQALFSNTIGSSNTADGFFALRANTTGNGNTANGANAGRYITDGITENTITNNSVFIGASTRANADNQTNQIVIGHNAIGLGSNTTVIGNSSTTFGRWFGNLLVGTSTNAGFALDVNGTARVQGNLTLGDGTTLSNKDIILNSNRFVRLQDSGFNLTNWFGVNLNYRHIFGFNANSLFEMRHDSSFHIGLTGINQFSLSLRTTATENQLEAYRTAFGINVKPLRIFTNNPFSSTGQVLSSGNILIQTGSGINGGSNGNIQFQIGNSTNTVATFTTSNSLIIGTTTDVASSILTVESTTKGFLPPRMTTTEKNAIASPATGLVVYDTTLNKLSVYTGATWETVTSV